MAKRIVIIALSIALALPALAFAAEGDYDKGVSYLRAGKVDEALKLLEPLASKRPDDPYLSYHLGLAYYKGGRLDEASDALTKTLGLAKGASETEFRLSAAFSNLGIAFYRKKGYDKAIGCFKDALTLDPGDGESRYYSGLSKMEKGDYQGAVEELSKAASLKKDDPKAQASVQNAIGLVFARQEEDQRAIEEFGKTLQVDPDNIEALYYLGTLNYKENGYASAKPYFDRITAKGSPDDKTRKALFTMFFNMGVDFQNRDMSSAAVETFEKASSLKPDDADAHYYRGYNLMALERYEEAVSEFKEALALKPDMARAQAQREVAGKFASAGALQNAKDLYGKGDFYAALPMYEKAVSLDPASAEAKKGLDETSGKVEADTRERVKKARALLAKGEYVRASEEARGLLRLNPGSRAASDLDREIRTKLTSVIDDYTAKARDAERRGALGEAAGYYETLLKLDPESRDASDALRRDRDRIKDTRSKAKNALEDGRLADAREAYEALVRYVPDDEEATRGIRDVKARVAQEVDRSIEKARDAMGSGDYEAAAGYVARALELAPRNETAASLSSKIRAHVKEPAPPAPDYADEKVRKLYLSGVEHYTKGELKEAIETWREVLRLDPGNDKAKSSITKAEEKMKQTSN